MMTCEDNGREPVTRFFFLVDMGVGGFGSRDLGGFGGICSEWHWGKLPTQKLHCVFCEDSPKAGIVYFVLLKK